jgi:hypothetical protein
VGGGGRALTRIGTQGEAVTAIDELCAFVRAHVG